VGNAATKRSFEQLFLRNCIKRLPQLKNAYPLSSIKDTWKGRPALIISSAPSVDKYIDLIATNRNRFNILAVDSAYPVLLSKNITPDLIISIDPQPWTEEHLLQCDPAIPVISNLSSWCSDKQPQNLFLSMNSHPFSQIIDHSLPDIGTCDSHTGTVAGDAIAAAQYLGSSRIFIVGVDSSFPNGVIYGRGTAYNHRYASMLNSRLQPTETLNQSYINRSTRVKKNGVSTRQSFLQYMESIDKYIQNISAAIYHIVADGLPLQNASIISSREELESILSNEPFISDCEELKSKMSSLKRFSKTQLDIISKIFSDDDLLDQLIESSISSEISTRKCANIMKLMRHLKVIK
jgi:hypothetical protein